MHPIRRRTWQIIEFASDGEDCPSRAFDVFIAVLILISVAGAVIGTVDAVERRIGPLLEALEWATLAIFSIEFLIRLWASAERDASRPAWQSRLRWLGSGGAIVDLVAILPSWIAIFGGPGLDARTVRLLRLMRLFRLLKVGRYSMALRNLRRAVSDRREELLISLTLTGFLLLIVSTLMYHAERDAQPEVFSSIPAAMWWGIATLTTVGYGDMAPVTPLGRALGGLSAVLGIGLFALPAGILASAFSDAMSEARRRRRGSQPDSSAIADG